MLDEKQKKETIIAFFVTFAILFVVIMYGLMVGETKTPIKKKTIIEITDVTTNESYLTEYDGEIDSTIDKLMVTGLDEVSKW